MNDKKLWNGRSSKNGASALPTCEKLLAEPIGHSSQYPESTVKIVAGMECILDAFDAHILSGLYLGIKSDPHTSYLTGRIKNGRKYLVHRLICGAKKGEMVDHINGNGLDNRRANLRIVTNGQNVQNRGPKRGRIYKGVVRLNRKGDEAWGAKIKPSTGLVWLGTHKTIEEAARAYDAAAVRHFGEFARLNFPHTSEYGPYAPCMSSNTNVNKSPMGVL